MADDLTDERECVLVGHRVVVGDPGAPRVECRASEVFSGHLLARSRLHEGRAADEDGAGSLDDDGLVAHRRDVGPTGGAGAHHRCDLRDVLRRKASLVVEDPPEVVTVRENIGLEREERPARIDEIDTWQVVLLGDLLRAEVLLHRQWEVGAAFHRRVVCDDDAAPTLDHSDAGHDAGRRRLAVVDVPRGESVQLEESRAGVDETIDAFAGGELAP